MIGGPRRSTLFPYTPLSRLGRERDGRAVAARHAAVPDGLDAARLEAEQAVAVEGARLAGQVELRPRELLDRKSTRLNSSHANISYAVFCLKKKNKPFLTVPC